MTKSFWAIVMVFSVLITAWAGFFVYNELQPKEPVAVPLTPAALPEPPPVASVEPSTTNVIALSENITSTNGVTVVDEPLPEEQKPTPAKKEKNEKAEKAKTKPLNKSNQKQSVVLKFKNAAAKKVYVVGEFNKWFRQPLKREGDNWSVTLKIAPGTYQYVFVVDDGQNNIGKRSIDPNNPKSKDGKLSILTVSSSSADN